MPMSLCHDAAARIMVLFACRRAGQDQTKTGSGSAGQVDSLKEEDLLTSPPGETADADRAKPVPSCSGAMVVANLVVAAHRNCDRTGLSIDSLDLFC